MNFPVNILFPTVKESFVSGNDLNFSDPLYVQAPCVSVLISMILGKERLILTSEKLNSKVQTTKTVLILCGYKRETFLKEVLSVKNKSYLCSNESEPLTASDEVFWMMDPIGRWISASEYIDVVYVPSLRGLRAILSLYHYSSFLSQNILAIWSFLKIHELSGELSAQGISKTMALAIEASRNKNIIFCDSIPLESPIQLLNSSTKISGISICSAIKQITIATVIERWVTAFWKIISLNEHGNGCGIWKYCGEHWKIYWKDAGNGKISDIEYTRLD